MAYPDSSIDPATWLRLNFVISGLLTALIALAAFVNPQLRGVEGAQQMEHTPAHGHVH